MSRRTTDLDGEPQDLIGEPLAEGSRAPDFRLQMVDLSDGTLSSFAGKTLLLCAVPSFYTGVCSREIRRFNEEAAGLDNAVVVAVSTDLPFAQKGWCGAQGIENVAVASDHRDTSFGRTYGCLISGGPFDRCLSRAVFVITPGGILKHVEYVPKVGEEPDYEAAIAAARS